MRPTCRAFERHARGKVRDVYAAGDFLVIVATDRLSAFDYVLPTPIPDKGRVLTQLTIFWLELLRDIVPNHFVSANVGGLSARSSSPYRDQLEGRSMLVRRAKMIEVECVARGYVSGSGWKDYRRDGRICGIPLPAGSARERQAARADLHAGYQGAIRPRREHFVRSGGSAIGAIAG